MCSIYLNSSNDSYLGDGFLYSDGRCYKEPSLNKWAEIPIIGSFAGALRVALAICHIAIHLFSFSKDFFTYGDFSRASLAHGAHIIKGFAEMLRGVLEVLPVLGNLLVYQLEKHDDMQAHFLVKIK